MTLKQFIDKVDELMKTINEDELETSDIMLFVRTDNKGIFHRGWGCPACNTEQLMELYQQGQIKHNDPNRHTSNLRLN